MGIVTDKLIARGAAGTWVGGGGFDLACVCVWGGDKPASVPQHKYPQIHVSRRISATLFWKTEKVTFFVSKNLKYRRWWGAQL